MSNLFSEHTEDQRQQAVRDGLSLAGCDGMSGLWFGRCCGRFLCLKGAAPFASPPCENARRDGYCIHKPAPAAKP